MQMEAGLDTGPMLHVRRLPIAPDETAGSLHDRLSALGAGALLEALPGIEAGNLHPQRQDDALATYAKKLQKSEALIDWRLAAPAIERQVRAFNPWPIAETRLDGEPLRIWRAQAIPGDGGTPGTVVAASRDGIEVATGDGRLRILELQPPGRRAMTARDYLNARDLGGVLLG
jgi:methionyl-tRNA formyltransferase